MVLRTVANDLDDEAGIVMGEGPYSGLPTTEVVDAFMDRLDLRKTLGQLEELRRDFE